MTEPIPATPRPHPRAQRTGQRIRYRVVEVAADHFAVVERLTGRIIATGFATYSAAWTWLANRLLDGSHA